MLDVRHLLLCLLCLQHELRQRDAALQMMRVQLTKYETQYRSSMNAISPGGQAGGVACLPAAATAAGHALLLIIVGLDICRPT